MSVEVRCRTFYLWNRQDLTHWHELVVPPKQSSWAARVTEERRGAEECGVKTALMEFLATLDPTDIYAVTESKEPSGIYHNVYYRVPSTKPPGAPE